MPKKSKNQKAQAAAYRQEHQPARSHAHPQPKVKHQQHLGSMAAPAQNDSKIRTTQASNPRRVASSSMGSTKESEMAAVGCLDPFAAFQRQYKTGLPFSSQTTPSFGFWSRFVTRTNEIAWTGGPGGEVGMAVQINPWCAPLIQVANSLDAGGAPLTVIAKNDPQAAFIQANFETVAVAYQGVRVRNLTPVLAQGGEMTIGLVSYQDGSTQKYDDINNCSTSITHSNGDPGVIAQMSYIGNGSDSTDSIAEVMDYKFCDPIIGSIDKSARTIVIRSVNTGSPAVSNIYEIEIVTYYLGVSFAPNSQVFCPSRYDVTPAVVNRLLDAAYAKSPIYSVPRNFVKDDGWDTVWTGVKGIVADVGLGLIGSAASAIGSAFMSLFDGKQKHRGLQRILALMPPHAYADLKQLVNDNADHAAAMKTLAAIRPPPRFSTRDLEDIAFYMRSHSQDYEIVSSGPAQAAASQQPPPGWKGVFSR